MDLVLAESELFPEDLVIHSQVTSLCSPGSILLNVLFRNINKLHSYILLYSMVVAAYLSYVCVDTYAPFFLLIFHETMPHMQS